MQQTIYTRENINTNIVNALYVFYILSANFWKQTPIQQFSVFLSYLEQPRGYDQYIQQEVGILRLHASQYAAQVQGPKFYHLW